VIGGDKKIQLGEVGGFEDLSVRASAVMRQAGVGVDDAAKFSVPSERRGRDTLGPEGGKRISNLPG
jgi:hypothetical protein